VAKEQAMDMRSTLLDTLLIIHLIGLMMGAGGGLGSTVAMRYASALQAEQQPVVRGLGPVLAKVSLAGLALLWVTGVGMVMILGSIDLYPWTFWAKMAFVATLTIATIGIEVTYAQMKKGNPRAAARLPLLGPMAGISAILAVIFAVLAFH
jgi:hypothetical protein